jgi:hypothetical protein
VPITGATAKVGNDVVKFMGWTLIDDEDGDHERRIHVRFAMSMSAALDLYKSLSDQLSEREAAGKGGE